MNDSVQFWFGMFALLVILIDPIVDTKDLKFWEKKDKIKDL